MKWGLGKRLAEAGLRKSRSYELGAQSKSTVHHGENGPMSNSEVRFEAGLDKHGLAARQAVVYNTS